MDCDEQLQNPRTRLYTPIRKHEIGGHGSLLDLSPREATEVLRNALYDTRGGDKRGASLWGYKNGRVYRFMCDRGNPGKWHGYPTDEKPPTSVLRQWQAAGTISNAEYSRMVKRRGRGN